MTPRSIADAAGRLRSGELRAVDLVDASLAAIAAHNARTNAFIVVDADGARDAARSADLELKRGRDRGPLHGMPISLKDLIDVAGTVTSAGSRVLRDRVAASDAEVVTRLRRSGAIFIGKTNLHEFALGTTSEDSAFGPVRHPRDEARSAGGSSGGAAVAVATGMGLAAIGTDTGGSIRIPAAACGVVGLKPSVGEVPTAGVIPLSRSLDHVGPLTLTVADAAVLWEVLANQTATPLVPPSLTSLRLRRLGGRFDAPTAPEVRQAFEQALERLAGAGAALLSGEIQDAATIPETYVNIVLPEAAFWHSTWLNGRAADYTPLVRTRLEAGSAIPGVQYLAARDAAAALRRHVDAALDGCDALVLPTLPIVAPPRGAGKIVIDPQQPEPVPVRSAMLRQTQPFNLSGHPAISLPIASTGLPVGLQLVGRLGQTRRLLEIAAACERIVL